MEPACPVPARCRHEGARVESRNSRFDSWAENDACAALGGNSKKCCLGRAREVLALDDHLPIERTKDGERMPLSARKRSSYLVVNRALKLFPHAVA